MRINVGLLSWPPLTHTNIESEVLRMRKDNAELKTQEKIFLSFAYAEWEASNNIKRYLLQKALRNVLGAIERIPCNIIWLS